jgi:hypothetical protein
VATSPFTSTQQIQEWPGEYLVLTCELPPMQKDYARAWCAFLFALRGQVGSFYSGDTSLVRPRGSVSGMPVVDGAGQSGKTLAVRGFTAGVPLVLRSGDWIQLGDGAGQVARMYMNLLDVNADSDGKAVLNIAPRLRLGQYDTPPADGAIVYTSYCKGAFRLASNDQAFKVDDALYYGISFSAREAL